MCPLNSHTHTAPVSGRIDPCFRGSDHPLGMEQRKQINAQVEVGVAVSCKDKEKRRKRERAMKNINRDGCIQLEH